MYVYVGGSLYWFIKKIFDPVHRAFLSDMVKALDILKKWIFRVFSVVFRMRTY